MAHPTSAAIPPSSKAPIMTLPWYVEALTQIATDQSPPPGLKLVESGISISSQTKFGLEPVHAPSYEKRVKSSSHVGPAAAMVPLLLKPERSARLVPLLL